MAGNGEIDRELIGQDTERLAKALLHAQDLGLAMPTTGGGGGGHHRLFGLGVSDWAKIGLAILGWFAVSSGVWFLWVRDSLHERPTVQKVKQDRKEAIVTHERRGEHPRIESRLTLVEATQRAISDVQVRQTAIIETQQTQIQENRQDLRRRRRRR